MNEIDLTRLDLNLLVTFEVLMSERSVSRSAARLNRTQSAVSHSLARLREQLGDPLLVKIAGGMAPSPYAQRLIEDVRPLLRSIQRIIAPPRAFDPKTSERVFRVAIADFVPTLLPRVVAQLRRQAPGVSVEWLASDERTLAAIADSQIDVALVTGYASLPEGVQQRPAGELISLTFARKDHPAIPSWCLDAWLRWPHISVRLGEREKGAVASALDERGLKRTIGASVPNFSQVPALLAQTDLLATMTPLVMGGAMKRLGLRALEPPIAIAPTSFFFVWSFRLVNDPGSRWFRELVMAEYEELRRHAALLASDPELVRAQPRRSTKKRRTRSPS
jgi:DNA-binding transcriptional LysR family regulator